MLSAFTEIRRNPLGFLHRVWGEHGDVVQFPIPTPPTYLVSSPGGVRRVLVTNARNYSKDTLQYRALAMLTGNGLLTADGEAWRRQRRLVQPAFHPRTLEQVGLASTRAADRLVGRIRSEALRGGRSGVVDVDAAMMETALEVVGDVLFGADLSTEAGRVTRATLDGLDVVVSRARMPVPIPEWLPTPNNRKLSASRTMLDETVANLIATRTGEAAASTPASAERADMLSLLLDARDDEGNRLSAGEIRDEMVTFIVAGHETVASALSWAWHLLGTHPDDRDRLHEEVDGLGGDATYDDLGRLVFTRAVFDEALRLYPPAWLITRTSISEDAIDGVHIPPGALIVISPYILHRHPDLVDDPEAFRPDRFINDDRRLRMALIPFGAGPRQCIGRDFSYVEAVLLLANVARRLTFDPVPGHRVRELPVVTVRPGTELPMLATARN